MNPLGQKVSKELLGKSKAQIWVTLILWCGWIRVERMSNCWCTQRQNNVAKTYVPFDNRKSESWPKANLMGQSRNVRMNVEIYSSIKKGNCWTDLHWSYMLISSTFYNPDFSNTWKENYQRDKLISEDTKAPGIPLTSVDSWKDKRVPKYIYFLLYWEYEGFWLHRLQVVDTS